MSEHRDAAATQLLVKNQSMLPREARSYHSCLNDSHQIEIYWTTRTPQAPRYFLCMHGVATYRWSSRESKAAIHVGLIPKWLQ